MKIFLITDIHHGTDSNYPKLLGEEYVNVFGGQFANIVNHLHSEMDLCDLVINLGDFIHEESREKDIETYREAMRLLKSETLVKHVAGNHDLRFLQRDEFASLIGEEKSYYSFDSHGFHHIVLDTSPTEPRGPIYVSEEQLQWLEDDLEKTDLKTLLYCHHPLDNQDMSDNYYFKERPERASVNNKHFVRKILVNSGKVISVFSGHTHFYATHELEGITYFTMPSFMENDGDHKPQVEYGMATVEDEKVSLEIRKLNLDS